MTQARVNQLAYDIVGCAIEVHKHLGPGLLESIYEECFAEELTIAGFKVDRQINVPIAYKGRSLSSPLRLDLLVNDLIIIELKVVEKILPVHKAQLLSYLKLTGKPKGLLINFHTDNIVKSTTHLVTEQFAKLPKT
jgi:GxxExxY protein